MIRNSTFAASRYESAVGHACLERLFHAVLQQRLIHHGSISLGVLLVAGKNGFRNRRPGINIFESC